MATAIFKIIFMLVFYLSSSNLAIKSFSLRASIQLFVNINVIMIFECDSVSSYLVWSVEGEEASTFSGVNIV